LNRSNPGLMRNDTRLKVARFLGRRCGSEEELSRLLAETGWEMGEEEWEAAVECAVSERPVLHGAPRLSEGRMVGREGELKALRTWLLGGRETVGRTMVVRGIGGAGKTTLSARVVQEREVQERYRDGIYWVRMEGREEGGALRRLARMAAGIEALEAREPWSVVEEGLKGKRVLVVLDGVEEQVDLDRWGDVIPQRGRLLVTSRAAGLEGPRIRCRVLKVEGLEEAKAIEVLTRGVPVDVRQEDLAWVVDVVEGLPLALYVGSCVGRYEKGLSGFVSDLRARGLDALQVGKRKERSVRVTFELSYGKLDEWDQLLFRALGVFLPWFEVGAVAAVLGENEVRVRHGLRRLTQMGLVDSVEPGEYEMHSLIHRYAAELSMEDERLEEWRERFARHYLELAQEADATGNVETIGKYLAEISQGAIYAQEMRDRDRLMAYVRRLGPYLSFGANAALEDWEAWVEELADEAERRDEMLRLTRVRLRLGQREEALRLAREVGDTPEGALIEAEALLALGRAEEAAEQLRDRAWWERLAQFDAGDELLFRAWVLSEHVRTALGPEASTIEHEKEAEAARARWEAGQTSSRRARLRLMRVAPLSENPEEAVRALEERMELAKEVGEWRTWLADALRRGYLLAREGDAAEAEMALGEIEERETEMKDARFEPWVSLLRAHVAWAAGRGEAGEQAYQAAAEDLAAVFGTTVFWDVAREGEAADEVWLRALRVDDPFRRVEAVCEAYPLFAWSGEELPDGEDEQREEYAAIRDEMRWAGIELPGWDWLVGEDDDNPPTDG